jgi:probable phosphoglycerate mutase
VINIDNDHPDSEMKAQRVALDGAQRRRIYLFRHGAVDYVDDNGRVVDDPDDVALNARGRKQTDAMSRLFAGITIDRAVCSGLRRTRETASRVLGDRDLDIETHAEFAEIRAARDESPPKLDLIENVAFTHWGATESGSRFLGGELYTDFYERVAAAMESFTNNPDWHNLAIFAHGGTNAAILGWTSGLGLSAFGTIDQATCCLNVLDFDFSADDQRLIRKIVRAMNITADDPAKSGRHAGGMESLARRLMKFRN